MWLVQQFGFDADFTFGDAVDVLIYLPELFVARVLSNTECLTVIHKQNLTQQLKIRPTRVKYTYD